jgi:hypothetical protein
LVALIAVRRQIFLTHDAAVPSALPGQKPVEVPPRNMLILLGSKRPFRVMDKNWRFQRESFETGMMDFAGICQEPHDAGPDEEVS